MQIYEEIRKTPAKAGRVGGALPVRAVPVRRDGHTAAFAYNNVFDDVRVTYLPRQYGEVAQREKVHASFLPESYNEAKDSTELGDNALEVVAVRDNKLREALTLEVYKKIKKWYNPMILRASLVDDCGVPDSRIADIGNQAHHIVESGSKIGQAYLANAGIDPNSAANGVLLPTEETDDTGNAAVHLGSHTKKYEECVNTALEQATAGCAPHTEEYKDAVIYVLDRVRTILLNENIVLNERGDANYDINVKGPESIESIFRKYELI